MSNFPQQLNRHSPVPLYHQLRRMLLVQLQNGSYEDGALLPSENELAEKYNVSRYVVRQALRALVAEGRIVAQQGAGYFVNQKRVRKSLPTLGSHTASMANLGIATQTLVTRQEESVPPDFVAERLLPPGEQCAVCIERVSYLDDEAVCLIQAYYPLRYSSVLLNRDLNNTSIYATLKEQCDLIPSEAKTTISVVFADQYQSSLLHIREGAPLLHIASLTWSEEGELFEYSSAYFRSDRFELELEQKQPC